MTQKAAVFFLGYRIARKALQNTAPASDDEYIESGKEGKSYVGETAAVLFKKIHPAAKADLKLSRSVTSVSKPKPVHHLLRSGLVYA